MTAITRRSPFSGKVNTREIDAPAEELIAWENTPRHLRPFVQDAFPTLSADDREFLLTGITPEEWDAEVGGTIPDEDGE